jgi:hypothetical protein
MTHPLIELNRSRVVTGGWLEIKNWGYGLCREGIWFGWRSIFQETVVMSYEHDPEELYVGWSINGTTVVDPGYSAGTPPFGFQAPGEPSVRYRCPDASGLYHRIALISTPGEPEHCLNLRVLYRTPSGAGSPPLLGPSAWVCLSGYEIEWPKDKVEEWKRCMDHLREILERYVKLAHVGPGDPVEHWLEHLEGDESVRVGAMIEALETLDATADERIVEAIRSELTGLVRWAESPGGRLGAGLRLQDAESADRQEEAAPEQE